MVTFDLYAIGDAIYAVAEENGLHIYSSAPNIDIARKETWPEKLSATPGAWKQAVQIEQLVELGVGIVDTSGFHLPYAQFDEAVAADIDPVAERIRPCPYLLKIDRHSDLGRPDFRYKYQLLEEGRPAFYDRV